MPSSALPPQISPWTLLTHWSLHPTVLPIVLAGALYWTAVRRVRASGDAWPRARHASFQAGVLVLLIALASPVDSYAAVTFSAHMVQHLLLTLVAPPLLAMGAPVTLAFRSVRRETARRLSRALASPAVGTVAHPVTGWTLFVVVPFAMHFSPLYDAALTNAWVHGAEHGLLLGTGLLFWWPLVGADPVRRRPHPAVRILSLMLAMPVQSFLAFAMYSSPRPLYETYASISSFLGTDALSDQRLAAAIMWVFGSLFLVVATLVVAARWRRSELGHRPRIERPDRRALD